MKRWEAIALIRKADGPRGAIFDGKDWAKALVLSLEILGLLRFDDDDDDDEREENERD